MTISRSAANAAPRVSVVIPAYNQARFLGFALESVRAQTLSEWEAIVVDDGATDETPQIAEDYARRNGRIRVLHQKNAGLAAARNAGLAQATGQWVAFLDSDDVWLPGMLAESLAVLESRPGAGVAVSHAVFIGGTGQALHGRSYRAAQEKAEKEMWTLFQQAPLSVLLMGNLFPPHAAVVSRAELLASGGFSLDYHGGCEDFDLWVRMLRRGVRFEHTGQTLALYRRLPGTMSRNLERMLDRWTFLLERHLVDPSIDESARIAAYAARDLVFAGEHLSRGGGGRNEDLERHLAGLKIEWVREPLRSVLIRIASARFSPGAGDVLRRLGAPPTLQVRHDVGLQLRRLLIRKEWNAAPRLLFRLLRNPVNGWAAFAGIVRERVGR